MISQSFELIFYGQRGCYILRVNYVCEFNKSFLDFGIHIVCSQISGTSVFCSKVSLGLEPLILFEGYHARLYAFIIFLNRKIFVNIPP